MTNFSIFIILLTATYVCQQYKRNAVMIFRSNDGYANAPQCYVTRTLPILFFLDTQRRWWEVWLMRQWKGSGRKRTWPDRGNIPE